MIPQLSVIGMSGQMAGRTTVPKELLTARTARDAKPGVEELSFIPPTEDGMLVITEEEPAKRTPVPPRIGKTTGGIISGVDLANLRTLQETEDLEYVGRMQRSE
ncbi:MAG: hypothetical protein JO007_15710 [Alphaproteobacteria bacterium]|nr:hypothetical protein [Alphaproteobacteria bacterium]